MRKRLVALAAPAVAAAVAAGALAGCGVPLDAGPHRLAAGDLPLGLSAASTTTTEAGARSPRAAAVVQVYLVAHDRLVARTRLIPSPATASEALGSVLAGPTVPETLFGVRSAIPAGTSLLGVHLIKGGRATVDLSADFAQTGGADQILAIAQVVYTLTSLPDVVGISFELAGQPVEVPTADGTLVSTPVGRLDYGALVAPGSS